MRACSSKRLVFLFSILMGLIWSLSLANGAAYADGKFTEAEKATFKNYFDQIARRLVKEATKKERGIGWINLSNEGKPEESVDFYTGNSGICYFLLKAYAATREKEYLDAANQGMDYILSQSKTDAKGRYFHVDRNGVFEGNAGPGYLFLYAYHVTRDKKYLKTAEEIADRMVALPDVGERSSPDIISGAAGAGIFLLSPRIRATWPGPKNWATSSSPKRSRNPRG
jgi:lantibiotic modifying enzyme